MIDAGLLKQIFSLDSFFELDYNSLIAHIVTSTIVILFVLIMSNVFEKRISPGIKYALWLLVVIKLLLPFPAVESKVHILNFIGNPVLKENVLAWAEEMNYHSGSIKEANFNSDVIGEMNANLESIEEGNGETFSGDTKQRGFAAGLSEGSNALDEVQKVENEDGSSVNDDKIKNNGWFYLLETMKNQIVANRFEEVSNVLTILYTSGVLVCSGIFLTGNLVFYKQLGKKGKYLKTYKNKIPMYRIEEYYGACLYGGLKPVIIVGNNKGLSIEQQHMVLTHEYVHYIHGDHIWSLIRCICVTLYWYHPLVWIAASVSRRDGELACDEGTLKRIGKKQRIAYGQSLLEIAARATKAKDITSSVFFYSTTAAGGKEEMKKRITMIARETKTSVIALIAIVILSMVCIGCTLGEPVTGEKAEQNSSESGETQKQNSGKDLEEEQVGVNGEGQPKDNAESNENVELADVEKTNSESKAVGTDTSVASQKIETVAGTDTSVTTQDIELSEVNEETASEDALTADDEVATESSKFIWPTTSTTISTNFGTGEHPITGEKRVIDYIGIAGNEGDSVYAVADGTITDVGFDSTKGNYIILTTEVGEVVTYGHLMGSKVPDGQKVKAGEIIGLMGKTGSATGVFLSISVEVDRKMVDPMVYFE